MSGMIEQFEGACRCGAARFVATGQAELVACPLLRRASVAAWLARHPCRALRARLLIPYISSVLRTQSVYTLIAVTR